MKTNEIVDLTWNVIENKRVVRSPRSVSRPKPYVPEWEPGMFVKTKEIFELT